MKIKYFIAHYGGIQIGRDSKIKDYGDHHHWWDGDNDRWVPAGMKLYRTTYDTIEEAMKAVREAKKRSSGWYEEIYIDSELA